MAFVERETDTEFEEIKFRLLQVHMLIMKFRLTIKSQSIIRLPYFKVMSSKLPDSGFINKLTLLILVNEKSFTHCTGSN